MRWSIKSSIGVSNILYRRILAAGVPSVGLENGRLSPPLPVVIFGDIIVPFSSPGGTICPGTGVLGAEGIISSEERNGND